MSDETTRIPVPTNGHELPAPPAAASSAAASSGVAPATAPSGVARAAVPVPSNPRSVPPGVAAGTDLRIAVSPAQVATGFAVIAGIIGLVLGVRRRRRR